VKEGKISRDKADEIIRKFNKKIDEWDGTGYPPFIHKSCIKSIDASKDEFLNCKAISREFDLL